MVGRGCGPPARLGFSYWVGAEVTGSTAGSFLTQLVASGAMGPDRENPRAAPWHNAFNPRAATPAPSDTSLAFIVRIRW